MKNILFIILVLFSCNKGHRNFVFNENVKLANLLPYLDYSKWQSLTKKNPAVSNIDWSEFQEYVLRHENDSSNIINPRKQLLELLKDSFDSQLLLDGLVIKERFYSGSKLKYQVLIGLISNNRVVLFKYDLLPEGFSFITEMELTNKEFNNWIQKINSLDGPKKSENSIIYCLSIFTKENQFSELVLNSNYFP